MGEWSGSWDGNWDGVSDVSQLFFIFFSFRRDHRFNASWCWWQGGVTRDCPQRQWWDWSGVDFINDASPFEPKAKLNPPKLGSWTAEANAKANGGIIPCIADSIVVLIGQPGRKKPAGLSSGGNKSSVSWLKLMLLAPTQSYFYCLLLAATSEQRAPLFSAVYRHGKS